MPNQPVIVASPKTYKQLEERTRNVKEEQNGISWYLSFKEPEEKCKLENEDKN